MTEIRTQKYVYIKNGNIVDQVLRILQSTGQPAKSGPDAFLADLLFSLDHNPILIISHYNRDKRYVADNIEAIEFDCIKKGPSITQSISNRFKRVKLFFVVINTILQFNPDRIICGRLGFMLWASYIVSRLKSIPFIHSRHIRINREDMSSLKRIGDAIDKWVIARSTACICHGPFTKQQLIDDDIPESKVFEFDISFHEFLAQSETDVNIENLKKNKKSKIILFVGRLSKEKGIFDLFNACSELLRQDENVILVYAGSGKDTNKLHDQIQQSGLDERIILLGSIEHEKLASVYKQATIVVAPTQHAKEGRCMSVMEALVMGIPVIAPNGGPFPYLIKHGCNGLLYDVDSTADLSKQIGKLLKNDVLYEKLSSGAIDAGEKLTEPDLSFSTAINHAFALDVNRN